MSVLVLVVGPVSPENIEDMKAYMAEILPDTRAYDGCNGVEMYFNMDDPGNMIIVEYWDKRSLHEEHVGWRTETGVMAKIGAMLSGPPTIRYLEKIDT